MTLRTVTYDNSTHKIVPREATDDFCEGIGNQAIYESIVASAPEYQEPEELKK